MPYFFLSCALMVATTLTASVTACAAELPPPVADSFVTLQNDVAEVRFAEAGGALVQFTLRARPENPLAWKLSPAEMPTNNRAGAPFQGHFLCVGRWGRPTAGEQAAGIPHNGEPANSVWSVSPSDDGRMLQMEVAGKIERWRIERKAWLSAGSAVLTVQETLTNLLPVGRFTALVQHATTGGDFLDTQTIVNSNAGAGFNQALIAASLNEHEYRWPKGFLDASHAPVDLTSTDGSTSYVSTHVIDGEWGWATVASPTRGLLLGYVWSTAEYPWLHVWHGIKDAKPWARGIEFGTTGLGDTFAPATRITTTFHGRTNALFVDANASVTKTYRCFLLPIPAGFTATKAIRCELNRLEVDLQIGGTVTTVALATEGGPTPPAVP
ncbi:MAG: hypothetical protein ABIV50_16220 [Opitutus sp.]